MERVFEVSGLLVMPFWVLMIVFPRAQVTQRVMTTLVAPAVASALYAALVIPRMAELLPLLARPQVGPIAALLGTVDGATIAWIHFLAFDLFVGRWIYLDGRARRISSWALSPLLLLTLMFGPAGLLAYVVIRFLASRGTEQPMSIPGGAL